MSSLCYSNLLFNYTYLLLFPLDFFKVLMFIFRKSLVTQKWCPQQNYNRTCHVLFYSSERDTLDRDIMEMRKNNTVLNAALKTKTESLLDLQKEVSLCILCTVQYN